MHIPDGFLSPQTCVACYAAAAPFWYTAWRSLKHRFEATTAAHVGVAAAFVFLVQMINVPIIGGTTGHAVGTALVSIVLGPAAAIVAASLALGLQAIVFGDGGLWAFGANVLTMAIVPAGLAALVWRIAGSPASGARRSIAAFAAGYTTAVAGALLTGILLGLQPLLFRSGDGVPQYFPLGLGVSLTAMLTSHLIVGLVEGAITVGAVHTLSRMPGFQFAESRLSGRQFRLVLAGLAVLVILVPLGILLPGLAGSGDPWGEWGPSETAEVAQLPRVPEGLERYAEQYPAPVPDYQFTESETAAGESIQYIGAALLGVMLVAALCVPLSRWQQRRLGGS